jgi:outer membrane receptor for ferrienterochelin and colicin
VPFSLLFHLALTVPAVHAAETTGQLRGTVSDTEGGAIPGVVITVTGPNLMGAATATSDGDGHYRFPALPPGEYAVSATKENFLPYRASGLLIVSQTSVGLDFTMKLAIGGETVIVEETRPVVDTSRVSTGAVLTRESMRDIPVSGRDYQGLTGFTPGVVGGANPNVHGSFDDSNQFYLDGVNNTDPSVGTFSMNMNYDAIEEVQVVTGGMDAEYGRSLGGAINVITRSGGNEFHGDAQFLYSNQDLRVYTPLEGEPDKDATQYQNQTLALNIGGPILKDKLWFFASLEGDRYINATPVDDAVGRPADQPMAPRDWRSGYWFGKLTFKPAENHKVWLQAQGDPTFIENTEQDAYTLPVGETIQTQGGWLSTAGYQWTPGSHSILNVQAFYQKSRIYSYSVACKGVGSADELADCIRNLDDPWTAENPGEFNGGEYPYGYLGDRNRMSLQASWTQFATFAGEHQFKLGAQAEFLKSDDIFPGVTQWITKTAPEGVDVTDTDNYIPATLIAYDNELEAHLTGKLVSAFLQDVWNPVPRLTVRPGIRYDQAWFSNDVGDIAFSKATFAPRLGAAFDLTNDDKTAVHAFYGRFYDTGFLAVADLLHQKSQGYSLYTWDTDTNDWSTEPSYSYATSNPIHDDLKNPWSDEVDLGLSRDLGNGWGLDLTFSYEYSQNFWEDDEVNLIWNEDGTEVIGTRNGADEVIFRIRTPDEAFTRYSDLEVAVSRQFQDKFFMMGSYTWSRAYGTNDAQFATGVFDNPALAQYETGLLSYDHTHVLKALGTWRDPAAIRLGDKASLGYLFGWSYEISSGVPYRALYYNDYYADWINYYDKVDGTYRLPAQSTLDLKVGVTLAAGPTRWDLTAECFNVFNDRTVTGVDTTYGNTSGDGSYTDSDGYALFGRPLTRQNPRYFQLGLRGEF